MQLERKRIILTGGAGGIGGALAERLASRGATIALLDRNEAALKEVASRITSTTGARPLTVAVDLLDDTDRSRGLSEALDRLGGVDLLINSAGLLSFRPFAEEDPRFLDAMLRLNLGVPMQIVREILPRMIEQRSGRIVNVGSTFGSIGFAWFTAYSASKAGLRGFSEALRRELRETGVDVTYIAPRAVRTPLNSDRVMRMAERVKMNMDSPEWVADRIVEAIEKERPEVYLGFPESLFVRINALLPRLVDNALRKQNQITERFAREN